MPPNPEPDGRVVVIAKRAEGGFAVTVAPQPPGAPVFRTFVAKGDAWDFARATWTRLRCGLEDQTEWNRTLREKHAEKSGRESSSV